MKKDHLGEQQVDHLEEEEWQVDHLEEWQVNHSEEKQLDHLEEWQVDHLEQLVDHLASKCCKFHATLNVGKCVKCVYGGVPSFCYEPRKVLGGEQGGEGEGLPGWDVEDLEQRGCNLW